MTKYVLNSGAIKKDAAKATKFYQEILKGLESPKVLFCFFAEKRENWEEKFAAHKDNFEKLVGQDSVSEIEMALPDQFEKQAENADVVILFGGDDTLLQHWLNQYNLKELFQDKVVAGSSAGSDALSQHFWTCDWRTNMDGLGLVPVKFIPHYRSDWGENDPRGTIDWEQAYKDLENYGDTSLPIYALEEGDFKVFEI